MSEHLPVPLPIFPASFIERFWSRVDKTPGYGPNGQCWKWTGSLNAGYGQISFYHHCLLAHRIAYFLDTGYDPYPWCVLHRCDWRPCCYPAHFFLGTLADNVADRVQKGRGAFGVKNGTYTHPEKIPRGPTHWATLQPERRAFWSAQPGLSTPKNLARGSRHGNAILTEAKVSEILTVLKQGRTRKTYGLLAERFHVSTSTIHLIDLNKSWQHVPRL